MASVRMGFGACGITSVAGLEKEAVTDLVGILVVLHLQRLLLRAPGPANDPRYDRLDPSVGLDLNLALSLATSIFGMATLADGGTCVALMCVARCLLHETHKLPPQVTHKRSRSGTKIDTSRKR